MPAPGPMHAHHNLLVWNSCTSKKQHRLRSLQHRVLVRPALLKLPLLKPTRVWLCLAVMASHVGQCGLPLPVASPSQGCTQCTVCLRPTPKVRTVAAFQHASIISHTSSAHATDTCRVSQQAIASKKISTNYCLR